MWVDGRGTQDGGGTPIGPRLETGGCPKSEKLSTTKIPRFNTLFDAIWKNYPKRKSPVFLT